MRCHFSSLEKLLYMLSTPWFGSEGHCWSESHRCGQRGCVPDGRLGGRCVFQDTWVRIENGIQVSAQRDCMCERELGSEAEAKAQARCAIRIDVQSGMPEGQRAPSNLHAGKGPCSVDTPRGRCRG